MKACKLSCKAILFREAVDRIFLAMTDKDPDRTSNINLRVSERERWEFKAWCAQNRLSQVDAFREAFSLLREHYTGPGREGDQ